MSEGAEMLSERDQRVAVDLFVRVSNWLTRRYGNKLVKQTFVNLCIRNLAKIEQAYKKLPDVPKKKRVKKDAEPRTP